MNSNQIEDFCAAETSHSDIEICATILFGSNITIDIVMYLILPH